MTTAELRLQVASVQEIAGDAFLYSALLEQAADEWNHCIFCGGITRGNVCIGHQDLVE